MNTLDNLKLLMSEKFCVLNDLDALKGYFTERRELRESYRCDGKEDWIKWKKVLEQIKFYPLVS